MLCQKILAGSPDLAAYRVLQARVRELEKEVEFLERASAFFARKLK
mgnify:CR=1 FL=1